MSKRPSETLDQYFNQKPPLYEIHLWNNKNTGSTWITKRTSLVPGNKDNTWHYLAWCLVNHLSSEMFCPSNNSKTLNPRFMQKRPTMTENNMFFPIIPLTAGYILFGLPKTIACVFLRSLISDCQQASLHTYTTASPHKGGFNIPTFVVPHWFNSVH